DVFQPVRVARRGFAVPGQVEDEDPASRIDDRQLTQDRIPLPAVEAETVQENQRGPPVVTAMTVDVNHQISLNRGNKLDDHRLCGDAPAAQPFRPFSTPGGSR